MRCRRRATDLAPSRANRTAAAHVYLDVKARAVSAALVTATLCAACGPGSTSSAVAPGAGGAPAVSPTATACTTARAVARWPLARRAATVVGVPVLDFNVAGVRTEIANGAGGLLFLGNATPPANLASRLSFARLWHPLVMADEEGGGIQRLSGLVPSLPWPRDMARTMTTTQVQAHASVVARAMRRIGVTVDLAPVVDVDNRPGPSESNPDGARSFSGDASTASAYGGAFVRGLRAGGVIAVAKHFPGLGGSAGNTDLTAVTTHAKLAPFRAAIAAGASAVMVSNAAVAGVTRLPASLSAAVIGGMLRGQLGFRGLVVTDSLSAGAVQSAVGSLPSAAVAALRAGADLLLFGSTLNANERALLAPAREQATFTAMVAAIVVAVRSGTLATARLTAAATAVVRAAGANLCG